MKNTYEQLIEYIINEQDDKARELFHQLVVEKSRDIYENLMDEADMDMGDENQVDSLVDEISADEHGMGDEDDEMSDDDLAADDDMDMDMEAEDESVEDRIMNLEDELDRLVAKFEELSSDEEAEEENEPGIHDSDFDSEDEEAEEEGEEYESDDDMETESFMREYVEKVTLPSNKTEGGAVGSSGQSTAVNKQSIVAKANKMGGTSQNIVTGGSEQNPTGATKPKNVYAKGETTLPGAGQFQNVPGAKTKGYTTKSTSYEKQHGKEGQTTDGKLPVTGKSVVGGKVR